jgi:hypothetical protein
MTSPQSSRIKTSGTGCFVRPTLLSSAQLKEEKRCFITYDGFT